MLNAPLPSQWPPKGKIHLQYQTPPITHTHPETPNTPATHQFHHPTAAARSVDLHKLCEMYYIRTTEHSLWQLEKLITQNKYCTSIFIFILLFSFCHFIFGHWPTKGRRGWFSAVIAVPAGGYLGSFREFTGKTAVAKLGIQ